jgi:hypothetical protein
MTHPLFRKTVMFTRTIARVAPPARRLLGQHAWKAILLSLAMGAAATADDAVGIVRVSDTKPGEAPSALAAPVAGAPMAAPAAVQVTAGPGCNSGTCGNGCGDSRPGLLGRCCFLNSGCGCHFLDMHCYGYTYAYNPWYTDCRDGRVYAAYGWGAPMTVPLAPTVTNQHNYGWGIPSSRLTPISRVAPNPMAMTTAVAPY